MAIIVSNPSTTPLAGLGAEPPEMRGISSDSGFPAELKVAMGQEAEGGPHAESDSPAGSDTLILTDPVGLQILPASALIHAVVDANFAPQPQQAPVNTSESVAQLASVKGGATVTAGQDVTGDLMLPPGLQPGQDLSPVPTPVLTPLTQQTVATVDSLFDPVAALGSSSPRPAIESNATVTAVPQEGLQKPALDLLNSAPLAQAGGSMSATPANEQTIPVVSAGPVAQLVNFEPQPDQTASVPAVQAAVASIQAADTSTAPFAATVQTVPFGAVMSNASASTKSAELPDSVSEPVLSVQVVPGQPGADEIQVTASVTASDQSQVVVAASTPMQGHDQAPAASSSEVIAFRVDERTAIFATPEHTGSDQDVAQALKGSLTERFTAHQSAPALIPSVSQPMRTEHSLTSAEGAFHFDAKPDGPVQLTGTSVALADLIGKVEKHAGVVSTDPQTTDVSAAAGNISASFSDVSSTFVSSLVGGTPKPVETVMDWINLQPLERPAPLPPHQVRLDAGAVQVEIQRMVRQGGGQVVMELTPPDQSKFTIELRLDDKGGAYLVVEGLSDSTRTRLEQSAPQLHQQFEQMGLSLQLDMRQQRDPMFAQDRQGDGGNAEPTLGDGGAKSGEPLQSTASAIRQRGLADGQVHLYA